MHELLRMKEFPFKLGDFPEKSRRQWTKDELIDLGHWALAVLDTAEDPQNPTPVSSRFTWDHLHRLHILRLAPSRAVIDQRFDGIQDFRDALGLHVGYVRGRYANWSSDDFARYATQIERKAKGKPRETDYRVAYQAGEGPSLTILEQWGGVSAINELIGYPDVRSWTEEDYISWGVQVIRANSGRIPNARVIRILASRKRGPDMETLYRRAGCTLPEFQASIEDQWRTEEAFELKRNADLLKEHDRLMSIGLLLPIEGKQAGTRSIEEVAKYKVARGVLRDLGPKAYASLAQTSERTLIRKLRSYDEFLTAGYIEMVAKSLNVFDVIWPMDMHRKHLHVPINELGFTRPRDMARYLLDHQVAL
jgi:hypothetical protein